MATAVLYTTVESVRAVLGLDASDVPEEMVTDPVIRTMFMLDLNDWYPDNYIQDWSLGNFDPTDTSETEVTAVSDATKKAMLLSAYSTWFAAYRTIQTLMVMPQQNSDGKVSAKRFDVDLEKMMARVLGNMEQYKTAIIDLLAPVSAGSLSPVKSESGVYDPITGT